MATVVTTREKTKRVIGGLPPSNGGSGHDGRSGHFSGSGASQVFNGRLGMALALAGIGMMFLGFTSAYVVRHGLDSNWQPMPLPPMLWLNTGLIVLSSVTFELARRSLKRGLETSHRRWLSATTALGLGFMIGQTAVWRQLMAGGVYLDTTAHSSFFYVLTVTHAVHLVGGLIALSYLLLRRRAVAVEGAGQIKDPQRAVDVTALYWHFLAGLWIYLFIVLFLWR